MDVFIERAWVCTGQPNTPTPRGERSRHCERSEAIQSQRAEVAGVDLDCFGFA
ncbi:hypothetical protein GCM10007884_40340 [Methylobacterium brachythecii]|uniref:Uncharacterized protein n=1 Tax=Methylobacterium brachythecii TaxID=1176177 RepID=A0ABQ6DCH9_9HYPH|nr:hypothetical protein GCM10007884_40340 [Methylobacterium brachythecii]